MTIGSVQNSRRKIWLIVLLVLVPTLLFLGWSQASLNLGFLRPSSAGETILLLALSALIFVAFVIFALILARILLKLYVERRQSKLGSRFKTKMVVAFLALSLVPVCFLFVFAYGLLNRTVDKWFGVPFDTVRRDAAQIVKQLRMQAEERTILDAIQLADSPELIQTLRSRDPAKTSSVLMRKAADLGLVAVLCFDRDGKLLARAGEPQPEPSEILKIFSKPASPGAGETLVLAGLRSLNSTTLAGGRPVTMGSENLGSVVAVTRLPINIGKIADEIQLEATRYDELSRHQKAVKRNALSILGLLTLLILFAATWIALFLSKQVTVPIQALAEGTHEVSSGNLGYQIKARADDELGSLIASFNEMTRQIQESRNTIEQSARELQKANRELEERGHTTQTILENISVGVVSFDPQGQITQVNSTLERMLGAQRVQAARKLADLFPPEEAREIARLFRRANRQGVVTRQMEMELASRRAVVAVTVSSIRARHGTVGSVMVLDDITDVLQAQRASAWGEVAQRVAHEIKNPLTPIQLSAERIQRLASRAAASTGEGELIATIEESARLIDREVATLKMLVDEFSRFARFPVSQPVPCSLNAIIGEALEVFGGRLEGVAIHCQLAPDLPLVQADPEQMKRVIVNLVDNAAEALEQAALKEVWVQTNLESDRDIVELIVADSGPGISPEAKERLFFPHFSTKRRGTGLGLAIVSRIVTEHKGTIRAEENQPTGTKIVIELPVERVTVPPDANSMN
jgi:two-component system, NtrC family, nitrogen regulation sensor histidine kinase NtrY